MDRLSFQIPKSIDFSISPLQKKRDFLEYYSDFFEKKNVDVMGDSNRATCPVGTQQRDLCALRSFSYASFSSSFFSRLISAPISI